MSFEHNWSTISSRTVGNRVRNACDQHASRLPLQDSKGRLIGINTAIADPSGRGANSGVGFAIPIDQVKGLVEQILTYGRIIRPVLGISIAPPQVLYFPCLTRVPWCCWLEHPAGWH
jgi:hypothetical protein